MRYFSNASEGSATGHLGNYARNGGLGLRVEGIHAGIVKGVEE
jgi:hypothetical protein